MVFANADIGTRMKLGSPLANDDRTGGDELAAKHLHAEHFRLGIPAVSSRSAALFLRHFVFLSSVDRCDLQFGELLAVALPFLVVLAPAHLEDADLVMFAMGQYGSLDSRPGQPRRTNLDRVTLANGQHSVDQNFLTKIRSDLFYLYFFADRNTVLLPAGFYDCVHTVLFLKAPWTFFHRAFQCTIFVILVPALTVNFAPRRLTAPDAVPIIIDICRCPCCVSLLPFEPQISPNLDLITDDMGEVDKLIDQRLSTSVALVSQVSGYIISSGGKRLRPALLLLVCGALGYSGLDRFNLAAVVEFIHTATLLHDDVVDESTLRRGRPTANQNFGNAASVLVGDFLYSRAFQMMLSSGSMRVMEVLADATNVISEGEVQQLLNTRNVDLNEQGYLQVIRCKTAKLFEASGRLAAVLAASPPHIEQACADYGQAIGTAFQVIDDVLDYDGKSGEMGKNLGDDLREGKVTLPLIFAMQRSSSSDYEILRQAILKGSEVDLSQVISIVRSVGAIEAARETAAREARRALDVADVFEDSPYRVCLLQLAHQLLARRS